MKITQEAKELYRELFGEDPQSEDFEDPQICFLPQFSQMIIWED